ncbi:MAG: glycosyltransferase [Thiohalocapsa sp.]
MPSHNGERWLQAALQSVADQNEPGIEIVLLDSSATPASLEIAAGFADRLDLRAESRPDLLPWPAKTNAAAAMARSPWISMLHQDDLWLPGRARAVRQWLDAQPDAVMHLHASIIVDGAGKPLGRWRCPLPDGETLPSQALLARLLVQNFIAIPAPVICREAYLAVGGMDDELWYTADWDLYLKLLFAGPVYYHREALTCFRIHGNSLTVSGSRALDDFRRQQEIVRDRYLGRLRSGHAATAAISAVSIDVNVALAAAAKGTPGSLVPALARLLALGPRKLARYLRDSRIVERLWPRLRARLAGGW